MYVRRWWSDVKVAEKPGLSRYLSSKGNEVLLSKSETRRARD